MPAAVPSTTSSTSPTRRSAECSSAAFSADDRSTDFRSYGRRGQYWIGIVYFVMAVAQTGLALAVTAHDFVLAVVWALMGVFWLVAGRTDVTADGVRVGAFWPRRRIIPWSDVVAVIRPGVWAASQQLVLRLHDGSSVKLNSVPVDRAAHLAALAQAPLEQAPLEQAPLEQAPVELASPLLARPARTDRPSSADGLPSEAELARRFSAFQQRNRELQTQLRPRSR